MLITVDYWQKLKAYGFSDQALSFLQIYLYKIFQRSVIDDSLSSWNAMTTEVSLPSLYLLIQSQQ